MPKRIGARSTATKKKEKKLPRASGIPHPIRSSRTTPYISRGVHINDTSQNYLNEQKRRNEKNPKFAALSIRGGLLYRELHLCKKTFHRYNFVDKNFIMSHETKGIERGHKHGQGARERAGGFTARARHGPWFIFVVFQFQASCSFSSFNMI